MWQPLWNILHPIQYREGRNYLKKVTRPIKLTQEDKTLLKEMLSSRNKDN